MARKRPNATPKKMKGTVTKLSKDELRMHGNDVNCEVCSVCGKKIYFTYGMLREIYTYRQTINGRLRYYCGYKHFREDGGGE